MINLKKTEVEDLRKFSVEPVLTNMKVLDVVCNVVLVLDDSGSMEHEYEEGHVQLVAERALALAMVWDADQKVDIFTLNRGFIGTMSPDSFKGWVGRNIRAFGGTPYSTVIRQIVERYGQVFLKGFFAKLRTLFGAKEAPVLPTYVLFVTDGDCTDQPETTSMIAQLIGGPIFIQFVGLGETTFSYLKTMDRRNTSFFILPCEEEDAVVDDGWLYQNLARGFSNWLKNRQGTGSVVGKD
jgi:hypothetical protein